MHKDTLPKLIAYLKDRVIGLEVMMEGAKEECEKIEKNAPLTVGESREIKLYTDDIAKNKREAETLLTVLRAIRDIEVENYKRTLDDQISV